MKKSIFLIIIPIIFFSCKKNEQRIIAESDQSSIIENNIIAAVLDNDISLCLRCLDAGMDVNTIMKYDDKSFSLLYYSVIKNYTDISLELIKHGADVNWVEEDDNYSVLMAAISQENIPIIEMLKNKNVNLDFTGNHGTNYFSYCLAHNKYKALYVLLENEAFRIKFLYDDSLWEYLIWYWTDETPNIIKNLFNGNVIFDNNFPYVYIAIENQKYDAVKWFSEQGIDCSKPLDYTDYFGRNFHLTPIEYAIYFKDFCLSPGVDGFSGYDKNSEEMQELDKIIVFLNSYSYDIL